MCDEGIDVGVGFNWDGTVLGEGLTCCCFSCCCCSAAARLLVRGLPLGTVVAVTIPRGTDGDPITEKKKSQITDRSNFSRYLLHVHVALTGLCLEC